MGGIRHCSQLKVWVKKWKDGVPFDERKGFSNLLKGRPRTPTINIKEMKSKSTYFYSQ